MAGHQFLVTGIQGDLPGGNTWCVYCIDRDRDRDPSSFVCGSAEPRTSSPPYDTESVRESHPKDMECRYKWYDF